MQEIETRRIEGNGGTVTLWRDNEDAGGPRLAVTVENADGETVATLHPDAANAMDTFLHPFVSPEVPNIFARFTRDTDPVARGIADAEAYLQEHAA